MPKGALHPQNTGLDTPNGPLVSANDYCSGPEIANLVPALISPLDVDLVRGPCPEVRMFDTRSLIRRGAFSPDFLPAQLDVPLRAKT